MKIKNHIIFFSGHLDWVSRFMRVCVGIVLNLTTLYFIEHMSALIFWSLILVSYTLLLEAIWGAGLIHSIVAFRKARKEKKAAK